MKGATPLREREGGTMRGLDVSWSIARTDGEATRLKARAKVLLRGIIDAWEDPAAAREIDAACSDAEPDPWRLVACRECGQPCPIYTPAGGEPVFAVYCDDCWILDVYSKEGRHIAHATQKIKKELSKLPPGTRLTGLTIKGKFLPFERPYVVGPDGKVVPE
jgi:hypothetical protein